MADLSFLLHGPKAPVEKRVDLCALLKRVVDPTIYSQAATYPYNPKKQPTAGHKTAGNYPKGHVKVGGIPISIENPAYSKRRPEWPELKSHYGYIKRTKGADGDQVDVFVKVGTEDDWDGPVFVINQNRPKGSKDVTSVFDEHKVMIGWPNAAEAKQGYLDNYSEGWTGLGSMVELTVAEFKLWLKTGDTTKPHLGKAYLSLLLKDVEGHAFHGNQWTGGMGGADKPTETSDKGVKGSVHELLSSGHSFTVQEMHEITGHSHASIKTAMSDIKNPKYAGAKGTLDIKSVAGHHYVPKEGPDKQAAKSPKEATGTKPTAPAATTKAGDKGAADASYQSNLNMHLSLLQENALVGGTASEQKAAILDFKNGKAQAMAEWQQSVHGGAVEAKVQTQVFDSDLKLYVNLNNGMDYQKAYEQWKKDTSDEKKGVSAAAKESSSPKPTSMGTKYDPQGKFNTIKVDIPENYQGISAKDFDTKSTINVGAGYAQSDFSKGLAAQREAFSDKQPENYNTATGQKEGIQKQLSAALKDSEAFQAAKAAYDAKNPHSGAEASTLEARLISQWAGTSGDNDTIANAMQIAAKNAFGMSDDDYAHGNLSALKQATSEDQLFAKAAKNLEVDHAVTSSGMRAAMQDFQVAQYNNTQAYLASKGITDVYLVRGMKVEGPANVLGAVPVDTKLQPLSSFTYNIDTANGFSKGDSIYVVKVPATQVMGSFRTGYGCKSEHELVVMAHKHTGSIRVKHGVSTMSAQSIMSAVQNASKKWKK